MLHELEGAIPNKSAVTTERNPFYGGIPTTSRHYEMVSREIPFPVRVSGVRTLDVGAGCSNTTASLLSRGADAYALDTRYPDFSDMEEDAEDYAFSTRRYEAPTEPWYKRSEGLLQAISEFRASRIEHPERYVSGSAENTGFPDGFFHVVYSNHLVSAHLSADPQKLMAAMRELCRITDPKEGYVAIAPWDYNPDATQRELDLLKILTWQSPANSVEHQRQVYEELQQDPSLIVSLAPRIQHPWNKVLVVRRNQ